MKKQLLIIIICSLLCIPFASAQTPTAGDFEAIHEEVGLMIERFEIGISRIASKDSGKETKDRYATRILNLFMGNGYPYSDTQGNSHRAVHMQVSSANSSTVINRTIPDYLNRLRNLSYAKVVITSADHYYLSNIYKVGDHYEATATIYQRFCGYGSDGSKKYCDVTVKTIRIIIQLIETYETIRYEIRFGDIDVNETNVY